jgi:hypothetical protein
MARVKYVGPHDAVDVHGVGTVAQGETVEVSAELGKSLCEQATNWQPVTAKTAAAEKTEA